MAGASFEFPVRSKALKGAGVFDTESSIDGILGSVLSKVVVVEGADSGALGTVDDETDVGEPGGKEAIFLDVGDCASEACEIEVWEGPLSDARG